MARPKRQQEGPSALERMEEAFWVMLEEGPYHAITVTALARRAGVNHNTIYYYFSGIDDMARQVFDRNTPDNVCEIFGGVVWKGVESALPYLARPEYVKRWRRACLFGRGDSAYLNQIFREMLTRNWYTILDIREEELTQEERVELTFVFNGLIAVLQVAFQRGDPMLIPDMMARPMGQSVLATLRGLKKE